MSYETPALFGMKDHCTNTISFIFGLAYKNNKHKL